MRMITKIAAGLIALLASNAAHAVPDFRTLPSFGLVCESIYQDRRHLFLQVNPAENTIELRNDKAEAFTFPVTKVQTSITNAKNEFGHYVTVPYAAWIWFQDKNGKTREVRQWTSTLDPYSRVSYFYGPSRQFGNDEKWGYTCIVAAPVSKDPA
jgi:hypothetical protein